MQFYTLKNPLDVEKCAQKITAVYKGANVSDKCIGISKSPNSLYIWFPSNNISDPIEKIDMEEDLNRIPFKNPYFTHIDFHLLIVLQNVIRLISDLYPEMIIWTDEGKFYTLNEFFENQYTF